jgi:hypothetical protein
MNKKDLNMLSEAYDKINVLGGKVNLAGEVVPDENGLKSSGTYESFQETIIDSLQDIKKNIEMDVAKKQIDPRQTERFLKELQNRINLDIEAIKETLKRSYIKFNR